MTSPPKGRPTYCTIDLAALRWNFTQVQRLVGPRVKILSIIKANAYGHGAVECARALIEAGGDGFGVATVEEAVELREAGIRAPILVLTAVCPEQLDEFLRYDLTPAISDVKTLGALDKSLSGKRGAALGFHLKVDTGMGRLGLLHSEIEGWLPEIVNLRGLRLEGLFSQLAHAESADDAFTKFQVDHFQAVVERLRAAGFTPPLLHLANSAGVIGVSGAHGTLVRPGIMLYGCYPAPELARRVELEPVLAWHTRIMQVKELPPGASVGYGRTFTAKNKSRIAALPVGYADGYHRLLSNRGAVLVRGKRAPIAGRISMDLTMIDVTDIAGVSQGDEVVLIGRQGEEKISADEVAGWAETISYEVLTSVSARVPRVQLNSKQSKED
ncbi:MAG TPA: alanine racemase [Verrucomicrobiae bacterium]|jgi:alanine racemase|nr:alanine racemase [Verrucomicrobiae bacterium]